MRYDADRLALARWEGEGGLVPAEIEAVRPGRGGRRPLDREGQGTGGWHRFPPTTPEDGR